MDRHWVEELFPPQYTYSTEEIHAKYENEPPPMNKVKALYEKVRQEVNKEKLAAQQKSIQVGETLAEYFEIEQSKLQKLEESCIWSHKELEILRESFKTARSHNFQLASMVRVANEQVDELETRCKKQAKIIESRSKKLHASRQECKRLDLHHNHLQQEVWKLSAQVKLLRGDISELTREKLKLRKEMKGMRKALAEERLARQDAEIELEEKGQRYELQRIIREDSIKLDYQAEINQLHKRINDLTFELEQERLSHNIDSRGLDHLRNHFASLPTQTMTKHELQAIDITPFF